MELWILYLFKTLLINYFKDKTPSFRIFSHVLLSEAFRLKRLSTIISWALRKAELIEQHAFLKFLRPAVRVITKQNKYRRLISFSRVFLSTHALSFLNYLMVKLKCCLRCFVLSVLRKLSFAFVSCREKQQETQMPLASVFNRICKIIKTWKSYLC